MTLPLTAQQRRKLQRKLGELRCPGCREKALYWGTARGTMACGSCATQRSLADLGLEWHAGLDGRASYWMTERDRAEQRRVYRE